MIFTRKKYLILLLLISLLTLGFMFMSGGSTSDPHVFSEEIFNFRRITLAPVLCIGSYIGVIWLITKK